MEIRLMVSHNYIFEDTPGKALMKLSVPMLFGMMAMTVFNLVDTWYVARLGTLELAAISFTFPVIMLLNGITMGIGVGLTAVISTKVGEGLQKQVQKYVRDGLILALLIVIVITTIGIITVEPLFKLLGATDEIMPLVVDYMTIWYLGAAAVVIPMVGNAAIRGTGDAVTPAWIMSSAAILNVILDPLLIFGIGPFPRLELQGAAIATVAARTITMIAALYVLVIRDKIVEKSFPKMKGMVKRWKEVLEVGVFTALIHILIPVGAGIITRIVASNGEIAVAAFGAGTRIEMFAAMIPISFASGMMVYVGQHWGAKEHQRLTLGLRKAIQYVLISGTAIYLVITATSGFISMFFTDDVAVQPPLQSFLKIVIAGIMIEAISSIAGSTYIGIRRPKTTFQLFMIRFLLLMVPLVYFGNMFWGLKGIFWGLLLSKILGGMLGLVFIKKLCTEIGEPL